MGNHSSVDLVFQERWLTWCSHCTCSCVWVGDVCSDWFEVLGRVCQGCDIATDLFLAPVDRIMQETLQRSFLDLDIGCESFMDLHFAGNFTCLAELLHILILVLRVMSEGASLLGLQVNISESQILGGIGIARNV